MTPKDDGGPVVPAYGKSGLSLRDWFAGQALAGGVVTWATFPTDPARAAYELADAMLAERKKEGGE